MSRLRRHLLCSLPATVGGLLALSASAAEPSSERVFLAYRADPACPTKLAFESQVEARTERARWMGASDGVRRFRVLIERSGGRYRGRLTIISEEGASSREVPSELCGEVVEALALITALAIDPQAKTTAVAAAPPPIAPPPAPAPKPPPAPIRVPAPPPIAPPPVVHGLEATTKWRLSLGAHAQLTSGIGSAPAAMLPIFVDLSRYGDEWLAPSIRLAGIYTFERVVTVAQGEGRLDRIAGQLSACPVRARLAKPVLLRPCLGFEAGSIFASSHALAQPADARVVWLAANATARLQIYPHDLVALEVEGGVGVPITRPRFFFAPDVELLTFAPLHAFGGGGLSVRLP